MLERAPALVRPRMHVVVKELLGRELRYQEEYTVFYHSYASGCFLYEVQTALATLLLGYPRGGPPIMRLIRKHFEGCDSLAALEEERESRHTDRSERFRKVAVSAVVSWFASGDYNRSFMMQHAVQGWSGSSVDMGDVTKLVEQVLGACGLQEGRARDALVADLLEVGLKWGLQMSQYRARAGRLFPPGAETCPGHILQIFVKNSIVDSVAYGARPLGKLAEGGAPITGWLARQCPLDGQARLLAHPDLFLGSLGDLVHVFHYASSPLYGDVQRRFLLQEVEDLLRPHFDPSAVAGGVAEALGFESGIAARTPELVGAAAGTPAGAAADATAGAAAGAAAGAE